MKNNLMAHMVAYYPDRDRSLEVALALADGGAAYLEVQFPFSDPSADGPVIQDACSTALEAGFRTNGGFELLREISSRTDLPLYVMVYAGMAFAAGIPRFLDTAKQSGASGVIIPDLMPGMDEGLYEEACLRKLHAVPVITPNIAPERLEEILALQPAYIYVALRSGITGQETDLDPPVIDFLNQLSGRKVQVLAGFGVRRRQQVQTLSPHVHAIIAGTCLVQEIQQSLSGGGSDIYDRVRQKVEELLA